MIDISINDHMKLICFWLSFSRWLPTLFHFPMFDNMEVPGVVKVLCSLIITFTFFPYTEKVVLQDIYYIGADHFWVLTFFYATMGIFIGYLVKMIMSIFMSTGVILTHTSGYASIRQFDPSFETTVGPFEKLIQMTVLMMVISSGAFIPMFKGGLISFHHFNLISVNQLDWNPQFFINFLKSLFLSSLLLASPAILANLLITIVMGIMSRMVPQMNILLVSFAVNIFVGLFVFFSTSDEFFQAAFKIYTETLGDWFQFVT